MNKKLAGLSTVLVVLFLLVFSVYVPKASAAAHTYYASPADQGLGNCSSALNSCDLSQALTAAFANTESTVIMSAGTYTGHFEFDTSYADPFVLQGHAASDTFVDSSGSGGFELGTLSSISISGITFQNNSSGPGVTIDSEGSLTVTDCVFTGNTGGGLIDTHYDHTGSVSISNSTFTNNSTSAGSGGGFSYTDSSTTLAMPITLTDNVFENNTAGASGGAVSIRSDAASSTLTLTGNTFNQNTAAASGGAVSISSTSDSSPILLNGNTFSGNTATNNDGGALYAFTTGTDSPITVGDGGTDHGNTFTSNSSKTSGGAFYIDTDKSGSSVTIENNTVGTADHGNSTNDLGGGGKVFAGSGLTLTGNTFRDNTAGGNAGGLAVLIDRDDDNTSDNSIANNTFAGNTAHFDGGGLNLSVSYAGTLSVDANTFIGNTATTGEAGGFRLQQFESVSQVAVTNNLFVRNFADTESGGFDYYDQSSTGIDFVNNTLVDNNAETVAGGANFGVDNAAADLNIYNNIFWTNHGNFADDVHIDHFNFDVASFHNNDTSDFCLDVKALGSESCVTDGTTPNFDDPSVNGTYDLSGNIDDNPLFYTDEVTSDNYTLTELSPAVDAGDDDAPSVPDFDFNGDDRVQNSHVDMGAFELAIPAGDLTAYVLTEVTPIASSITATSATYSFSIAGSGEAEYVSTSCGNGSSLVFTSPDTNPTAQSVQVNGLASGNTYTCSFHIRSIAGDSNSLTIGPFAVHNPPSSGSYGSSGGGTGGQAACCNTALAHRNGTLILDGSTVYLIKDGQRFGFRNPEEYQSYGYNFSQVVPASGSDKNLKFLPENILKAMVGTLVLDQSDGKTVYMIGDNFTKRGFVSAAVFKALGYSFANLPKIDLTDYPTGPVIDSATEAHPEGSLVLDGKTVWWILNGVRQGFESEAVFNTYGFSLSRMVKADAIDLNLSTGPLVKLRDGTLVLDGGSYYMISDGSKVLFGPESALTQQGYKASNAIPYGLANY
jgi:predicted outer membrane repeat protein